jgi:hypothetical protein
LGRCARARTALQMSNAHRIPGPGEGVPLLDETRGLLGPFQLAPEPSHFVRPTVMPWLEVGRNRSDAAACSETAAVEQTGSGHQGVEVSDRSERRRGQITDGYSTSIGADSAQYGMLASRGRGLRLRTRQSGTTEQWKVRFGNGTPMNGLPSSGISITLLFATIAFNWSRGGDVGVCGGLFAREQDEGRHPRDVEVAVAPRPRHQVIMTSTAPGVVP